MDSVELARQTAAELYARLAAAGKVRPHQDERHTSEHRDDERSDGQDPLQSGRFPFHQHAVARSWRTDARNRAIASTAAAV